MCHLLPYRATTCKHRWYHLSKPCAPGINFRTAPPAHPFTRPRTFLGGTMWYPAPPGACPDCDLKGRYDGDRVRLHLGKGGGGERSARAGMWGEYGNGFWGANNGGYGGGTGVDGWGYGYGSQWNPGMGYSGGYGSYGRGYVPGEVAVRSFGGYGYRGGYKGRQAMYPARPGLLGCFGL